MKLSTRSRYGARLMLDLALHYGEGPISLKDIARRQQISLLYLRHLITPLTAAGIVKSERGTQGGVWLARAPKDVKLNEIVRLLEGSTDLVDCIENPGSCDHVAACATRDLWIDMSMAMTGVLETTSLQDLAERQQSKTKKDTAGMAMYHI